MIRTASVTVILPGAAAPIEIDRALGVAVVRLDDVELEPGSELAVTLSTACSPDIDYRQFAASLRELADVIERD